MILNKRQRNQSHKYSHTSILPMKVKGLPLFWWNLILLHRLQKKLLKWQQCSIMCYILWQLIL